MCAQQTYQQRSCTERPRRSYTLSTDQSLDPNWKERSFHPETDDTKLLGREDMTRYRALLGSANWIVTLGRFDIAYATSTMARFSMAPREGHLNALKRIFGYLRVFPNGELIDRSNIKRYHQRETYGKSFIRMLRKNDQQNNRRHSQTKHRLQSCLMRIMHITR